MTWLARLDLAAGPARRRVLPRTAAVLSVAVALAAGGDAAAQAPASYPVPARTLYPGDVLNADVLTEKQGAAGQGYATQVSELAGKSAKRTLIKGEAIPLSALRSPVLVMQGKSVLLKAEGEGFSVSLTATAMESGAQGETIRVRNPESGVIVSGVVGADGTVMASAP